MSKACDDTSITTEAAALLHEFREQRLKVQTFRSGPFGRHLPFRPAIFDRTHDSDALSGREQNRFNQIGGRGFAVGARDSNQFKSPGGMSVEGGSGPGQCLAGVVHLNPTTTESGRGVVFRKDRNGTSFQGLSGKKIAVRLFTFDCHEKAICSHLSGIVGKTPDFNILKRLVGSVRDILK